MLERTPTASRRSGRALALFAKMPNRRLRLANRLPRWANTANYSKNVRSLSHWPVKCSNPECPSSIPPAARFCITCSWDNGYPNVRQAHAEEEALAVRLRRANTKATRRRCLDQLGAFREQLRKSVAVIATSPSKAHALLSDSLEAFTTFYRVIDSGARSPRSNWFDQVRGIADELLFPNYREYITFAALSLNGQGCWYYGSVHLVLADFAIRHRATVFEENSLYFCEKRHLGVHQAVPAGFRAVWNRRDDLAACKLGSRLDQRTTAGDFPEILLSRTEEAEADFIEVHVFERLNRESVQRVIARRGGTEDDQIFKALILRHCQRVGLPYEEVG